MGNGGFWNAKKWVLRGLIYPRWFHVKHAALALFFFFYFDDYFCHGVKKWVTLGQFAISERLFLNAWKMHRSPIAGFEKVSTCGHSASFHLNVFPLCSISTSWLNFVPKFINKTEFIDESLLVYLLFYCFYLFIERFFCLSQVE